MDHKEHKIEHDINYVSKTKGFFNYVFSMDHDTKHLLMNYTQYIFLAFIFIISLSTAMKTYYPIIDETNSSIEICLLILLYIFILFFGIYYVNRIICFIPNYSGTPYIHCNDTLYLFPAIISILYSIISYNSQIKDGIHIILERINEKISSNSSDVVSSGKKKKKNVVAQQQQPPQQLPNMYIAPQQQNTSQTTQISQLPIVQMNSSDNSNSSSSSIQDQGYDQSMGPMAANDGVSAFGSAFGSTW